MKLNLTHAFNILLIQFLYCMGLILLMAIYGMLSGSALEVRPYTWWDAIASGLFVFMLIGATTIFNIKRYFVLKTKSQIEKGRSHLLVQFFFLIALSSLYVLSVCKLI